MIPTLPQSDSIEGRAARQAQLARARDEFRYNHTYMSPLAFAQTVPETHHPSVAWRLKLGETVVRILENTYEITRHASRFGGLELRFKALSAVEDRRPLQDQILNSIMEGLLGGRARSEDEIKAMFIKIARPPYTEESQDDGFFAHMRVGGPNPMVIRGIGAGAGVPMPTACVPGCMRPRSWSRRPGPVSRSSRPSGARSPAPRSSTTVWI